ncbi:MAG: polyamine aminopropyltransferase [Gammaproteobacteria bacterium]|nr:MAG: polyamine aminopropyltransferase [Gammaproteobacteria bacterium]
MQFALLVSVFVIASCGLIYELVAGALSSYLLGDSITQFSTVIGTYLFAMGVGSWLSRHIHNRIPERFIVIEIMVGLVGGFSAAILFLCFAFAGEPFRIILYVLVTLIGILVGIEIPLVMRLLEKDLKLSELVSSVLSVDYLGALLVSVLFPLLLAPHLGFVRTSLMFGAFNVIVAIWVIKIFKDSIAHYRRYLVLGFASLFLLGAGFVGAEKLMRFSEIKMYGDDIIYTKSTPYQRIVLTRWRNDFRLFLNGNLQFSSRDEYRYHESLVHPALATLPHARDVLVLGGGDGMAVREVLKYPNVEHVTLVDLDPQMTELFKKDKVLSGLNDFSLQSPKVEIINADALRWMEAQSQSYDAIVVDFPDPTNYALGKLYTVTFYQMLHRHLRPQGLAVVQTTSPLYAPKSYWMVHNTARAAGFITTGYHALVPSFGEWGFMLLSDKPYQPPIDIPVQTRFLNKATLPVLFIFPQDMQSDTQEINRLDNQALVRVFEQEWGAALR